MISPRTLVAAAVTVSALVGVTACGAAESAERTAPASAAHGYTHVSSARIRPGDSVPKPTGTVVLTLRGVPRTNVGDTLEFDLTTLDELGTVRYSVDDRQAEGHRVTFSGPLMSTVLRVAGARGHTLHCVALNDYAVNVPTSDANTLPLMLATKADGRPMSVEHYGPTRFIYPTSGYHLDRTVYDSRWIWQLSTITVR